MHIYFKVYSYISLCVAMITSIMSKLFLNYFHLNVFQKHNTDTASYFLDISTWKFCCCFKLSRFHTWLIILHQPKCNLSSVCVRAQDTAVRLMHNQFICIFWVEPPECAPFRSILTHFSLIHKHTDTESPDT